MNVLVIAYYFPPYGGGPVARVHGFVKHLPEAGVQPVVLTVKSRYHEDIYLDERLGDQYKKDIQIYQSNMWFGDILHQVKGKLPSVSSDSNPRASALLKVKLLFKKMLFPDEQILWVPDAIRLGRQIITMQKIGAIFASAPPFSAHVVGACLARQFNIPLLLDYRDLWSRNVFYAPGKFRNKFSRMLEGYTTGAADKLIVTNEAAKAIQAETFHLASDRIVVIENGFDDEAIQEKGSISKDCQPQRFRIRYIGALTRERTPEYFLRALKRFHDEYPAIVMDISFVGYTASLHENLIKDLGLDRMVHFLGLVTKASSLELMADSEILLLLQRKSEGGETAIPGKLYEYLVQGIPVLAMDEGRGATTIFLEQIGSGLVCEYADVDAIFEALKSIVLSYEQALKRSRLVQKRVMSFNRRSQAHRLADVIRACAFR